MILVKDYSEYSELYRVLVFFGVLFLLISISGIFGNLAWAAPLEQENSTYPRTVTDDQDKVVTLLKEPHRIISLAPSNTEILFSLGLDDNIVGDTDYCNYPEDAIGKSKIGGFSTVSIEKVMALKPDLVIAANGNNPDTITRIRDLGVPVYYSQAGNMDNILTTIEKIGYITGRSDTAEGLSKDLNTRAEKIEEKSKEKITHPTVAHVIWYDPIYVSGKNTFQDELINLAGGVNVFDKKDGHQIASVEELLSSNPDIILVNSGSGMGSNGSEIADYFKSDNRLSGLKAIKNNNIIIVDSDTADRAGPRLWDLLEKIAQEIQSF